ncbi:MAG: MFS transporter [Deltaproteobacteria bacterium]|nr:MFS transporter [Deltaproteobacteria bacterium]
MATLASRLSYAWWVPIAGALAHAVSTALTYFGLSAYFPSLEREFGWSRTAISGAFSLARIESGLLGPAEGYITDKLGPRRMMLFGITLTTLGFFALSLVTSLPSFYVVIIVGIVLGSSLGFYVPISIVVATTFRARRSLAFGIFRMGPGLSGVLVPVVGWMLAFWGWRVTALASGFLLFIVGIPLALSICHASEKNRTSEEMRLVASPTRRDAAQLHYARENDFTAKEALSTLPFWTLSVAMALRHLVTEGVSVHFVVLLVDRGWSQELASSLLGISALISVPGRLGMAWLGDFLDKRRLIMALLSALGVSVFFMGSFSDSIVFMTCMTVYSVAYGGLASLQEPIRADYFGTRYFATIQGFSRLVQAVGVLLGPLMAGFFYDLTRSYALPFALFGAISILATLCMVWARPPQRRIVRA